MDENWSSVRKQFDNFFAEHEEDAKFEIGDYFKYAIGVDIKHLLFTLSRYKFVSKLVAYKKDLRVLELGCSEAWGGIMLQQNTDLKEYVGVDLDAAAIEWNRKYLSDNFKFMEGDMFELEELNAAHFNMVCSLDVIEHIDRSKEEQFFRVIHRNLLDDGIAIIGTPNEAMTPYASDASKEGHINLYNQRRLYDVASKYFDNVFIFNMNDEVVNTGFAPMACYMFAVCCGKKAENI